MKLEEMIIGSPIGILEYYVGVATGSLLFAFVNLIPAAILLYIVGLIGLIPHLIVLGVLALFLGSFIGLIIVLRVKNPTNISAITNPAVTLTTLLPPVYYPASMLPHGIGFILSLVPTATLMEAARFLSGLPTVLDIWVVIINLGVWFAVALILLSRVVRWGLR
jgi:ABC-2 type transport system permease protein